MKHCLWCGEKIESILTWENLLSPEQLSPICLACNGQLEKVSAPHCTKCHRHTKESNCHDCVRWQTYYSGRDPLQRNFSIYTYNDFMKAIISNWKYRGDYELVNLFQKDFTQHFTKSFPKQNNQLVAIPIPLSSERLLNRAFNQAMALAQLTKLQIVQPLTRFSGEKQSKKTRKERMKYANPFKINYKVDCSAVLIDDIYTTGRTIRYAAELLKENGCAEVYSFTLIRG